MSSHPGKSYPTFILKMSEEPIYRNASKDKLFGYVIEAPKGPINEPTYIASNEEAIQTFGVDFAPHFYQQPTGLVLIRVGIPDAKEASITYNKAGDVPCFKVTAVDKGESDIKVKVIKSLGLSGGYQVTVTIPNVISRTFSSLENATAIVKTINNKFAKYIKAELLEAEAAGEELIAPDSSTGALTGGSFGKLFASNTTETKTVDIVESTTYPGFYKPKGSGEEGITYSAESSLEAKQRAYASGEYTITQRIPKTLYSNADAPTQETGESSDDYSARKAAWEAEYTRTEDNVTYYSVKEYEDWEIDLIDDNELATYTLFNNTSEEYEDGVVKSQISLTAKIIYKHAFDLMKSQDIVGIATLSELQVVQGVLKDHIDECTEEETAILRFGITAFLDYDNPIIDGKFTLADISSPAEEMNNEYLIYIGQGTVFKKIDSTASGGYKLINLNPVKSIMLYTGIRSSLAYDEAIFGGEDKKILQGVVDVLPIIPNVELYKADREELNENGVTTFKKEYDRVTFLEGVTTSQDSDVLSYENIMSIVVYVTKRLIKIAKVYQGKKLNEDLKESLKTALSNELKTIQETDGSLVAIDEYNIPPYDVEVESAAMVRFNEEGELVRESKVIARVKIVPIGALRDIELGVIVI